MDFRPGDKVISRLHGAGVVSYIPSPQPGFPVSVKFKEDRMYSYTQDGYYFDEQSAFRSPFPDLWKEEAKDGPF